MKIGGYDYKVVYRDHTDVIDCFGRFMPKDLKLVIADDLAPAQTASTILHEVIEAINYHANLKMEHNQIMALESGLFQVLVDNWADISQFVGKAIMESEDE